MSTIPASVPKPLEAKSPQIPIRGLGLSVPARGSSMPWRATSSSGSGKAKGFGDIRVSDSESRASAS